MKIKKNLAIKLVKELIQDENFKKDIIDLISATSDSSGIAKNEEKKIFNNLLKVLVPLFLHQSQNVHQLIVVLHLRNDKIIFSH